MLLKSTVVVALLTGFVSAANTTFDPTSIDASTRSAWCSGQLSTCGTLCSGDTSANTCDTTTLNYTCACTANNSAPGLQYYTTSLPTYICEAEFQTCIIAGQNNAAAQRLCTETEKNSCGHLLADKFVAPSTTSSSSAEATASSTPTGSATSTSATPTTSSAANMVMSSQYGPGLLAAGVAAFFGFML